MCISGRVLMLLISLINSQCISARCPINQCKSTPKGEQTACTCRYIAVLCFLLCVHATAGIPSDADLFCQWTCDAVIVCTGCSSAKSSIGGLGLGGYHPNTHHAYTVHSGTNVEQVRFMLCALVCWLSVTKEMLLERPCVKLLMQAVLEQTACVFVAVRLLVVICFCLCRDVHAVGNT